MPVLFLFPFVLYSWSFTHPLLNWDDQEYIMRCGWLLNLSWANVKGIFLHSYFVNYHPLTMLSYMIDVHLWGYSPMGFRLPNIALHSLVLVVSFAWLRRLGVQGWVAFFALLLFAAHPLRVESVVWISERKDVLCGVFYMLSLYAWTRADLGSLRWLGVALLALLIASLSKAMAVSIPLIWLLHELVYRQRFSAPRLAAIGVGLVIAVVFAVLNKMSQAGAIVPDVPLKVRLAIASFAPLFYTMKTLVPTGLSPLYALEFYPSAKAPWAIAGVLFCVAGLATVVACWKRAPAVSFALLASAVCLGPVSGIVTFGSAFAADRYSYVPTLLLLPALAGMGSLFARMRASAPMAAAVALILVLGASVMSIRAQEWWSSSTALWDRAYETYPDSYRAKLYRRAAQVGADSGGAARVEDYASSAQSQMDPLALVNESARLAKLGRFTEALALVDRIKKPSDAAYMRYTIADAMKDPEAAVAAARQMLSYDDTTPPNRALAALPLIDNGFEDEALAALDKIEIPTKGLAVAYGLLAFKAHERGEIERAVHLAEKALAVYPADFNGLVVMAERLPALGRQAEAIRRLERAHATPIAEERVRHEALRRLSMLQRDPALLASAYELEYADESDPVARAKQLAYAAGNAESDKRWPDALRLYGLAVQVDPDNVDALHGLGILRLMQGKPELGINVLERAARLAPDDEEIAENLRRARERHAAAP